MKRFAMFLALGGAMLLIAPVSHAARFGVGLSGANEAPPNASPGVGSGFVETDPVAHTLRISFSFSGLTAPTSATHIHCCVLPPGTASVATTLPAFIGFTLGTTSGSYDGTFSTLSAASWNPAYIAANGGTPATAEAALFAGMLATSAYLNVHTTAFPGGEIRGFLTLQEATNIPTLAQGSLVALVAALLLVGFTMLRKQDR